MIDDKRGSLVEAIGAKASQLTTDIGRTTDDALKAIEGKGFIFAQSMTNNSADIARMINTASEVATGAINKSLKDIELTSRNAIDQSRQVSVAAVTEMQETSKMLRTDTVALFERLREGNILLQEVLTGAHANLNSLEQALVSRVAEFVSTMNDVSNRTGSTTKALDEQIRAFNTNDVGRARGPAGAVGPVRPARPHARRRRARRSTRATTAPARRSRRASRCWRRWLRRWSSAPPISISG